LSSNLLAQEMPLKIGVVGLTHTHVHWILGEKDRDDIQIVGIVEPNRELAKRYSKQHGYSMHIVYNTLEEMIAATQPEAVTAFGTIYEHLNVVEVCAPLGIHVMVEKPLAVSLEHAMKMEALAKKYNIQLLTNYETTWYPSNHKAYDLLKSEAVGDVRKVIIRDGHKGPKKIGVNHEFLEWLIDPVQNGGGAIMDFGCYGANLMTWLQNGQKPNTVTAVTQQLQAENNPNVDDDATIILTYDNSNAIIQASWDWPIGRKDMEIYGLNGAIFADNRNKLRVRIAEGYDGYEEESYHLEERQAPLNDPFALFAAVIRNEIVLPPFDLSSLENNMIVMEILEAARKSAQTKQTIALASHAQNDTNQTEFEALKFENLFNSKIDSAVSCYRIPAIITAPNGDLVAAIDERVPSCGDLKWNDDINIVARRSNDNGVTWSRIETIVDYPQGESASDPSMIVDGTTGTIFLFFNFMDLVNENNVYYLKVIKSVDNGKTWSSPVDITSQISKEAWHNDFKFITSGRGIQTSAGKLLHTLVNLNNGLHLFASDDHGEKWYLIDHPIIPANESKIVELVDGTWMINSRINNKGIRYVHRSKDEGATWVSTPDSTLVDPGCNASIIRYTSVKEGADKNRLLFSNANSSDERRNMTLRISYDEGETWSNGKTIYKGDSAYSSMTILPNGDIGVFFEKDDYQENVFVRITLDWLTEGKDKYSIAQDK